MEKATIHNYARMCRTYSNNCAQCPMDNAKCNIAAMSDTEIDKANEIILNWCKEHLKCNDLGDDCIECRKKYWLAEVGEHDA